MRDQQLWPEHRDFINQLAEDRLLVLAAPIGELSTSAAATIDPTAAVGDDLTYRALLILDTENEHQVATILTDDPWSKSVVLETRTVYRWEILVGDLA